MAILFLLTSNLFMLFIKLIELISFGKTNLISASISNGSFIAKLYFLGFILDLQLFYLDTLPEVNPLTRFKTSSEVLRL